MTKIAWQKTIYISSKETLDYDDYGNQIVTYSKPKKYLFNVQPVSSEVDLMEFGEKSSMIQKAVISRVDYEGVFKENDLAYLDGVTPTGEANNGDNANYRLYPPRNQNKAIVIYFERITGK